MRRIAQFLLPFVVHLLATVDAFAAPPQAPATAPPADAQAVERARLDRLGAIAAALQAPDADAVALFTEGVRLAGFVVWSEERAVLAEPIGAPRLRLAVTDAEIRGYCALFRRGDLVARDDLFAGLDVACTRLELAGLTTGAALAWLRNGADAANPSVRALHFFLDALGRARAGGDGAIDGEQDVRLDPLQALLLLRVLTEEVLVPARRHLARIGEVPAGQPKKGPAPFGSQAFEEMPGWAEDGFVGVVTNLQDEIVGRLGKWGAKYSNATAELNAIATIAKFILTYTYLESELRVEAPGEPLVRRKDTQTGERRTLVARFWINGSKVTDFLKEHRLLATVAGLDLDMPKSGALKGVETEWQIKESRYTTKTHLLVLPPGHPRIDRIKTDDNGEARIQVDGAARPQAVDKVAAIPVYKQVRIVVTPQVKAVEMQQDVVDAVLGALGIKGGAIIGFLTPVIECLYRMKWTGARWMDLEVLDWIDADVVCQAEVVVEASGAETTRDRAHRATISRRARFVDVRMESGGVEEPVELDPEMRKLMPKAMLEQLDRMAEMAKQRWHTVRGPGRMEFEIRDSSFTRGATDDCLGEQAETRRTVTGRVEEEIRADSTFQRGNITLQVDLGKMVARLGLTAECDADVVATTTRNGKTTQQTTKWQDAGVFAGLAAEKPWNLVELEMEVRESPSSNPEVVNYYGVAAVPVRFGDRGQFSGKAIVSWSLTRRAKRK